MRALLTPRSNRRLASVFCSLILAAWWGSAVADRAIAQEFIKSVQPSVYYISVRGQSVSGKGTGFLISGNRFLATNYHVIRGATEYTILVLHSVTIGAKVETIRRIRAQFVTALPDKDLAILRADEDLPGSVLPLAGYDPDAAAQVVAIGYPGAAEIVTRQDGMEPSDLIATVTLGNVSRVVPNAAIQAGAKLVQHTAPINHGNSGGPLFDACGTVVGVNTFGPANRARVDGQQLKITVPQGIFFSVHSGDLAGLALSVNLPIRTNSAPCKPGAPAAAPALQPQAQQQPATAVANAAPAQRPTAPKAQAQKLSAEDERAGASGFARLRTCLSTQPCDAAICDAALRRSAPAAYIERMRNEISVLQVRAEEMCLAERATAEIVTLRTCAESKPCDYVGQCEPDVTGQWTPAMIAAKEGDLGRLRLEARQACFKQHAGSIRALGDAIVPAGCYRGAIRYERSPAQARETEAARCLDQRGISLRVANDGGVALAMPDGERQLTWVGKVDSASGDIELPAASLSIRTLSGQVVPTPQNARISGKFWRAKIELGACGVGTLAVNYKADDAACGSAVSNKRP